MHEAAPHVRIVFCHVMQNAVHQMVADKGTGGIGNGSRQTGLPDFGSHSLDRQIGKICGGTVPANGSVNGLIAFIIRNPGIIQVNGYPLRSQIMPSAGLTDAQNHIRLLRFHFFRHHIHRLPEHRGDHQFDNLHITDPICHQPDSFQCRVDC